MAEFFLEPFFFEFFSWLSFFKSVQKKACHNDKDNSGDESSAEVQSTTKITDFLVVDKSSVLLVKQ